MLDARKFGYTSGQHSPCSMNQLFLLLSCYTPDRAPENSLESASMVMQADLRLRGKPASTGQVINLQEVV